MLQHLSQSVIDERFTGLERATFTPGHTAAAALPVRVALGMGAHRSKGTNFPANLTPTKRGAFPGSALSYLGRRRG